ncbi:MULTISPECIES: hypothetical protein [unclassified Bradyrhizobium]|uniref:hypothetical protein n=1 Tax=unclassified Bradyrhizobium TaxID=2631580 RepID=UPI002915DDCD|nr:MULTISPECIES: hypothetical protein [unclassified Bradyrhizobium]
MPTPGLSLLGFMDAQQAIAHLQSVCVCANPDPAILSAEWNQARARLGGAIPRAGQPNLLPLPDRHAPYIAQLQSQPWCAATLAMWPGHEFKLVEIDPLLAFQLTVDDRRSNHHCGSLVGTPILEELLPICLPLQQALEPFMAFQTQTSVLLKSNSLNLQAFGGGVYNASFMGLQFGLSLPFIHVVRCNGRCYLHNGFHRALGIRRAGATHMPCVFRDVPDHAAVGIRTDGSTFSASLLESANPPTVGHFTRGRAWPVELKRLARYLHVSWSEYVLPED